MTDPGERLRSSLAADQSSAAPSSGMADFDSPIAMEALRATRVLHAADQDPFPEPNRIRLITIANQKGGVGKTTSTVNLGVALALYGLRTLVLDLDPQGNTSTALGVEHTVGTPSVYDALVGDSSLAEVVHPTTASPKLLCVPATIDLAGAEIELVSVVGCTTSARELSPTRAS
jgi:chromosome partitioning protein